MNLEGWWAEKLTFNAHVFPKFIQISLEWIDGCNIHNRWLKCIPSTNNSGEKKCFLMFNLLYCLNNFRPCPRNSWPFDTNSKNWWSIFSFLSEDHIPVYSDILFGPISICVLWLFYLSRCSVTLLSYLSTTVCSVAVLTAAWRAAVILSSAPPAAGYCRRPPHGHCPNYPITFPSFPSHRTIPIFH